MSKATSLSALIASFSREGKALLRKYGLVPASATLIYGESADRCAVMDGLAQALLSVRGEAPGVAIASNLLASYADASPEEKTHFLTTLATKFGPDRGAVDIAISRYREEGEAALSGLAKAILSRAISALSTNAAMSPTWAGPRISSYQVAIYLSGRGRSRARRASHGAGIRCHRRGPS